LICENYKQIELTSNEIELTTRPEVGSKQINILAASKRV